MTGVIILSLQHQDYLCPPIGVVASHNWASYIQHYQWAASEQGLPGRSGGAIFHKSQCHTRETPRYFRHVLALSTVDGAWLALKSKL